VAIFTVALAMACSSGEGAGTKEIGRPVVASRNTDIGDSDILFSTLLACQINFLMFTLCKKRRDPAKAKFGPVEEVWGVVEASVADSGVVPVGGDAPGVVSQPGVFVVVGSLRESPPGSKQPDAMNSNTPRSNWTKEVRRLVSILITALNINNSITYLNESETWAVLERKKNKIQNWTDPRRSVAIWTMVVEEVK